MEITFMKDEMLEQSECNHKQRLSALLDKFRFPFFSEKIQFKKSLLGYFFSRKSNGFTLAEVLITLGIIGIVSAMTIPTVINKTNENEYNSAAKEALSQISQAVLRLQAPDIGFDFEGSTTEQERDALCDVLSCVQKDTVQNILGNVSGKYLSGYKNYKSSTDAYVDIGNNYPAAILKNGMIIANTYYISWRTYIQLYIDTNGKKGPNMFGKDFLLFEIIKNNDGRFSVTPSGASNGHYIANEPCRTNQTTDPRYTWPCSAYRLYHPQDLP